MVKCKNCKHLGYISDGYQVGKRVWCEKMADSPDLEIERECDYYVPMTTADRIRSMTDEELARFIVNLQNHFGEEYEGEQSCLSWLQKESEE